jgi:hypothetical protein
MSDKYPGGFITMSPTAPTGGLTGAAPGVWTAEQAMQNIKAGTWPVAPGAAMNMGLLLTTTIPSVAYYTGDFSQVNGKISSAFDSSGNFYQTFYVNGVAYGCCCTTINTYFQIYLKFDKNLNYQSILSFTTALAPQSIYSPKGLVIDSSNNLYIVVESTYPTILKYSSAGSLTWGRYIYPTSSTYVNNSQIIVNVDSSSNVFLTTARWSSPTYICCIPYYDTRTFITKYNSSGTRQWTRAITNCGTSNDSVVDAAGNIWVLASNNFSNADSYYLTGDPVLVKINTSGAFVSANYPTPPGAGESLAADSSSNIYVLYTNGNAATLAKFNSSNAIQWARRLSSPTFNGGTGVCRVDSSGNVYIAYGSSNTVTYVAKYNSSGTIQWQRSLSVASAYFDGFNVGTDGFIYISLGRTAGVSGSNFTGGSGPPIAVKLPADGGQTGAYTLNGVTATWASTAFTEASYSLTDNSVTKTVSLVTVAGEAAVTPTNYTSSITYTQRLIL